MRRFEAIRIQGLVTSGAAEAQHFIEIPWVRRRLREQLGFEPYPGTLNLHLPDEPDRLAFDRLKRQPGIPIEPDPGYCAARCYRVVLEGRLSAAIIVPDVPGYPADTLELLAPVRLRDELGVHDGSTLTVSIAASAERLP